MTAVIGIISRHGLSIDAYCRNQPNKSKLALWKLLLCFNSCSKQLYVIKKMDLFSYKSVCCMCRCCTHIEVFTRRVGLGFRKMGLGLVQ